MLVDCRGLRSALEAVRVSVEAVRVSVEAVRVSIEALRCFRGRERQSGSGSIPLTNGYESGRVDPDPDTDRNESTNVPISKLRIETKPKRFDVFQNF